MSLIIWDCNSPLGKNLFKHNDSLKITGTGINNIPWSHRSCTADTHRDDRFLLTRMPSKWNRQCRTDRHKELQQINDSESSELGDQSISSLSLGIYRQVKKFFAVTEAFSSWLVEVCTPLLCSRLWAQEKGKMCNLHLYSKDKKKQEPRKLKVLLSCS